MMYETKHKYLNIKIKLLLLIFIRPLMWQQHVYGKSSTYDKESGTEYPLHSDYVATDTYVDVNDDDGDFNIKDMKEENPSPATKTTMMPVPATITGSVDNNNNATIYVHINENDNNSNKLPQNVAYHGYQPAQPTEMIMKEIEKPPPTEQAMMPEDQLNETDYEIIPEDNKDTACRSEQKGSNNLKKARNDCDEQMDVEPAYGDMFTESQQELEEENDSYAGNEVYESDLTAKMQKDLIRQFTIKYKQSRRVTLFTCKRQCSSTNCGNSKGTNTGGNRWQPDMNMQTVKLLQYLYSQDDSHPEDQKKSANTESTAVHHYNDLMIKVVEIDHLIMKLRAVTNNLRQRGVYNGANRKGGLGSHSTGRDSNTFTSPNWLDHVLRPENFPQVVILNLACGNASRRLLEMASNKALFNSMYHWLLMEDYVFNRQTEIDDADDIKNKMNSSGDATSGWGCGTTSDSKSNIEGNSNNTDKEDVNDSSKSALVVKKLSFSTADVAGVSASVLNKQYESQLLSSLAAAPALASVRAEYVVDERTSVKSNIKSPTVTGTGSGIGSGGGADGDDMEIIEKFLEKLNININTELILAKRRMRSISTSSTSSFTSLPATTPASCSVSNKSITMMPSSMANSASPGSGDYNTLQKMDYYILYDVWNPGRQYGGKLNVSEVGEFSMQQGFWLADWYGHSASVMRRLNMHLAEIRCLVVVTHKDRSDSLHDYLTSHYDTHLDSMNRFNFALLSHVRDLFNFSFILSKTSTWGYLKNGKFDGMIGALVRKQADIGGSPIFFRIERAKVIDYTTRTWVARPCFIFRHPRSTKKDRIVFLQPFSNDVWILLAACGVMTILLLWALTTLEPEGRESQLVSEPITAESPKPSKFIKGGGIKRRLVRWCGLLCGQDLRDNTRKQRAGMFLESILFYVGSICQQGLSFSTRSFAGRCIVIISLMFSFAIYQFYSASIVGTLLMEKPKTIRSLRDLIHSALEIGIEDIVYNRDYFLRTKDPDAQELYAKKVTAVPNADGGFVDAPPDSLELVTQTPLTEAQKAKSYRDILHSHETGAHAKTNDASNWYEPEFGVAKIRKGRFAFHVDVATAYKIIADTFTEKEICDLTEIQLFPPQKMVSIVQKGSPLRKAITYGLRRITEVGLTDYERKVWHSPKPRCVKQLHTDDLQVDMQTFTSALLVLVFGFVVSLLILTLEIIHHRMWQQYATTTSTTTTKA